MQAAGIAVVEIGLHDSQSWCLPHEMEQDLAEIKRRWPEVRRFHLHMHNARGMALPSIYAALRTLGPDDTVLLEGTLGGIGGGQYQRQRPRVGHGADRGPHAHAGRHGHRDRASTWTSSSIASGCWSGSSAGRSFGQVSKAGPRPATPDALYDPNMPGDRKPRGGQAFQARAQQRTRRKATPLGGTDHRPILAGSEAPPVDIAQDAPAPDGTTGFSVNHIAQGEIPCISA